jgi:hypothetical protein
MNAPVQLGMSPVPEDPREREIVCLAACEGIPTAELKSGIILELVAACVHLRDDERVRQVLERLSSSPPPSLRLLEGASDRPESTVPARRKFRVGMRVRMTGPAPVPNRRRGPTRSRKGIVSGFSLSRFHVRVIRDGRNSSESSHMNQWEEDPDTGDANE